MNKWHDDDLNICLHMYRNGYTYEEISECIDKSSKSIRSKLYRLGEKRTFDKKVSKCLNCGVEFEKIGLFCGRSCSAIFNNKKRIRINKCLNCNNEISSKKKYCDNKCQVLYERNILFNRIKNGDITLYEKNYKNYLIYFFGEKCMRCGWNEKHKITGKVPIQLEHKDGNSDNNCLDNLEILCPNCHSLTLTFGSLNKGRGRKNRRK
jgi:predicted nucleic acid-binding Zn ribbon protein